MSLGTLDKRCEGFSAASKWSSPCGKFARVFFFNKLGIQFRVRVPVYFFYH